MDHQQQNAQNVDDFDDIKERKTFNLDRILVEEIGEIGPYQIRTLVLCGILIVFAGWTSCEYIFTTARISSRCLIEECETEESAKFNPLWILNAVPADGSSFDNCKRFDSINGTTWRSDVCPAALFNRNETVDCEKFVYENKDTIVYEYGLACEEWRRSFIGSVRTFGTLLALPITGYMSDRYGRRFALTISAITAAWMGILRSFAGTYIGFLISELFEAICGSSGFTCAYILLTELVGPKYRVAVGASVNTFFSLGQLTLGLIAWSIPSWKNLTRILYIPQFIAILYYWIISESIRWYMSKGRFEEAEIVLKDLARVNKKKLSEKSLQLIRVNAVEEQKKKALDESKNNKEPLLIVTVFRNKAILTRVLVSPIWWITNTLVYYGLSINSVDMSGNRYINYVTGSAAEIPGFWTAVILLGRIGRKPVIAGAFWVCAACQIGYILMPAGWYGASLALYMIGKYSIAMAMSSVYVYTAELYPTIYRHRLFAFSSMMGRIGSIISTLTPALAAAAWYKLPFALFGGFALISGLLVLITPETLGHKLPDTIEEATMIGAKNLNPAPSL